MHRFLRVSCRVIIYSTFLYCTCWRNCRLRLFRVMLSAMTTMLQFLDKYVGNQNCILFFFPTQIGSKCDRTSYEDKEELFVFWCAQLAQTAQWLSRSHQGFTDRKWKFHFLLWCLLWSSFVLGLNSNSCFLPKPKMSLGCCCESTLPTDLKVNMSEQVKKLISLIFSVQIFRILVRFFSSTDSGTLLL